MLCSSTNFLAHIIVVQYFAYCRVEVVNVLRVLCYAYMLLIGFFNINFDS